jgi:hypothetical protein
VSGHFKDGVCWAATADGVELPVVDITNPEFAVEVGPSDMPAFVASSLRSLRQWSRLPAFVRRRISRGSMLTPSSNGPFLSGMATYLNKLGPANLDPALFGDFDRRASAMLSSVAVRLRLRSVSRLLADALISHLEAHSERSVRLISIAGGPATDSINALLLLNQDRPDLLTGREVVVQVLDIDTVGPRFASAALRALCGLGAPLSGIDATVVHTPYDWSRPAELGSLLEAVHSNSIVPVCSSEGGLFEYGSDEEVVSNLRALMVAASPAPVFIGTAWHDNEASKVLRSVGSLAITPREVERISALAGAAGWSLRRIIGDNPVYNVFALAAAG